MQHEVLRRRQVGLSRGANVAAPLGVAALFVSAVWGCRTAPGGVTTLDLGRREASTVREEPATASSSASQGGRIAWTANEEEARLRSARNDVPLFVFVSAGWSTASKRLEDVQLADPRVVSASRGVIPLRIDVTDVESLQALSLEKLGVTQVPALIVIASSGREVFRADERVTVDALLDALSAP